MKILFAFYLIESWSAVGNSLCLAGVFYTDVSLKYCRHNRLNVWDAAGPGRQVKVSSVMYMKIQTSSLFLRVALTNPGGKSLI